MLLKERKLLIAYFKQHLAREDRGLDEAGLMALATKRYWQLQKELRPIINYDSLTLDTRNMTISIEGDKGLEFFEITPDGNLSDVTSEVSDSIRADYEAKEEAYRS